MYVEEAICDYLREEIFPQIAPPPYGEIEMTSLGTQKPVCLFLEKKKNIVVVGKLFKWGVIPLEDAWLGADKEYLNLRLLREQLGMDGDADRVVAPLGESKELSALLVTERAPGQTLDYYIARAIFEQQHDELFQTLSHLARFFIKLHEAAKTERLLSPDFPRFYFNSLLDSLDLGPAGYLKRAEIEEYAIRWWYEESIYSSDRETIVHGDATPTNFLFDNGNVTAIDLESMKWADRCWDLGFIAAELKHHFMWRTGNGWAAEPFIGHFLWQYTENYGDTHFFQVITRKLPLYMALGLLRIARNCYVGDTHIERLVTEAKQCLKYGL
jgi:aminoglycoside phosphotransferase (APT) family kinase protein